MVSACRSGRFRTEERYDGYLQLENGVGMLRLLKEEVEETLAEVKPDGEITRSAAVSIATGQLAGPFIEGTCVNGSRQCIKTLHCRYLKSEMTSSGNRSQYPG